MSDLHVDQLRQLAKQGPQTAKLPPYLRRLHHRVQTARDAERVGMRKVVDDEGRSWGPAPGINRKNRSR